MLTVDEAAERLRVSRKAERGRAKRVGALAAAYQCTGWQSIGEISCRGYYTTSPAQHERGQMDTLPVCEVDRLQVGPMGVMLGATDAGGGAGMTLIIIPSVGEPSRGFARLPCYRSSVKRGRFVWACESSGYLTQYLSETGPQAQNALKREYLHAGGIGQSTALSQQRLDPCSTMGLGIDSQHGLGA